MSPCGAGLARACGYMQDSKARRSSGGAHPPGGEERELDGYTHHFFHQFFKMCFTASEMPGLPGRQPLPEPAPCAKAGANGG